MYNKELVSNSVMKVLNEVNLSEEEKLEIYKKVLADSGYDEEKDAKMHQYRKSLEESKKYGLLLTNLRNDKEISRDRLAEIVGIPSTSLARIENAENVPNVINALCLAKYYDTTVEELFGA